MILLLLFINLSFKNQSSLLFLLVNFNDDLMMMSYMDNLIILIHAIKRKREF